MWSVEGVLRRGARVEVDDAAPVVVELHHDEVKGNGAVKSWANGRIWIHTLGRCRKIEAPTAAGRGCVHEISQTLAEGDQVVEAGLKVKVEAIDDGCTKGTVDRAAGIDGPEHVPNQLGTTNSGISGREAALGVGGAAKWEDDGLLVSRLADLDVLPNWSVRMANLWYPYGCLANSLNLGTVKEIRVAWESSAIVSSISKVGNGRTDAVHEGKGNDL